MSELIRARLLRAAVGKSGPIEPTPLDWSDWTSTATAERVVPLLFASVARLPRRLPDANVEHVESMQLDVASLCVRLEQRLNEVASSLDTAGVRFAALKGVATAHLDYDDPSQRQFGDVDILVDPDDLGRARQALEADGWRQAYALPRYHELFAHAVTFKASGIAELDVHQHIAHRALGLLVPTQELLASGIPYGIAGRRLWALSDQDRLIHASIHAVTSRGGYRRLSSVADVLVLSRKQAQHAHEVLDRAEEWRVRPLVERAIGNAYREAMLPIPEGWSASMVRPIRHRSRLVERAYLGQSRRPAVEELAYLRVLPSWRDRLLYLYGHLRVDAGPGSGGLVPRLRYIWSRLRQ